MRLRKEGSMEDKKELRWMGFHAEGGRHVGQPSLLIVNYAIEYDKDYLLKWVHRGPELMIQNSWSYLRSQGVWARSKIQDPRSKIQDDPKQLILLEKPRRLNQLCHEDQPQGEGNPQQIPFKAGLYFSDEFFSFDASQHYYDFVWGHLNLLTMYPRTNLRASVTMT